VVHCSRLGLICMAAWRRVPVPSHWCSEQALAKQFQYAFGANLDVQVSN
jgi:hypothetical protein